MPEVLPSGWRSVQVSDIASKDRYACVGGPFGSNLTRKDYVDEPGVPIIRGVNMGMDEVQFNDTDFVYVSDEKARSLVQNMARPGDLVFTQRGTLGQVAWIPEKAQFKEYVISQSQMKLTVDPEIADPGFVYGYFRSPVARQIIDSRAITTGVPHINLGILRDFPILLPPLDEQRRIAGVLGALDDKIEANRRMNASLDALARAVFHDRFGQYEGRVTHPAGWQVVPLASALSVVETGDRPKGGVSGITEGVPSIGAESITGAGEFNFEKTKYVPRDYFESLRRGVTQPGDVLLYKDGGRPGTFEPHVSMTGEGFPFDVACLNSHVYRLRSGVTSQEYLYLWFCSDSTMDEMRRRGTGVAIPSLARRDLLTMTFPCPPEEERAQFDAITKPLFQKLFLNSRESRTLAVLRDGLLPRLLSGELRVREVLETSQATS